MAKRVLKYPALDQIRRFKGLTVDDLMSKMGYSRDTYYKVWQAPNGNIKSCDLVKLHDIFGISTDSILGLTPFEIVG